MLLTEGATPHSSGELPWRTSFGAGLSRLRHQHNDAVLAELGRVYIRDALARWLPSVEVVLVRIEKQGAELTLHIRIRENQGVVDVSTSCQRP